MSCENIINVPKGADHLHTIKLYDQDGNLITSGGSFTKIVVIVRHVNGTLIAKFSKNSAVGYEPMDLTNIAAGEIKIKLLTAHTVGKPEGKLFYEIHAVLPDGSITDDSVLDLISRGNYLCNIIDSETGGTTLP